MTIVEEIKVAMEMLSIPEKKAFYPRFFKAGKGEYAEGDLFIGITVPDQRAIVKEYWQKISLEELSILLSSPYHEHRHCALLILVQKFEKTKDKDLQKKIVDFYLKNKEFINNWDLVDSSCYKILGKYCYELGDVSILKSLSKEDHLWSKRMGIVSTMFFIKKGVYDLTFDLATENLYYPHDLMHKANGWLLREVGNKNEELLIQYLKSNYHQMPRTCLRYAIEKLDEDLRQDFLKGRL